MRNETRQAFNGYLQQQAKLNSVDSASATYSVEPSVQQRLETAVQESSDFLKKINVIGVDDQEGEAIILGVSSTIAGRTNTKTKARSPRGVASLNNDKYSCKKTDFDTCVSYQLLDSWAKFPDFQARLSNSIVERQALDRIMIGFNGKSAAEDTDREANPLLEDVNIGWIQKYRTSAPERVMASGKAAGKVTIGVGGDYRTLDGLVFDAVQLLDPWHRKRPDLVVLVDRNLLHTKFLANIEGASDNENELAAAKIIETARLGGLPIEDAPFFLDGAVMITTLKNLSIYWQITGRRRLTRDEPDYDRVADYQSSNDAYVIEDFGLGAVVENIEHIEDAEGA